MSVYQLRGFVNINAFVNNTPGAISPIGELSALGQSYSKEVGYYRTDESPAVRLMSFNSVRDDKPVSVDVVYFTLCLRVSQWMFGQSIAGVFKDDPVVVRQAVQAEFGTVANVLAIGAMATNGRYWYPESITLEAKESDSESNRLTLWFADEAFRNQYDLFEITVVPPFDNLDDFFLPIDTVITRISAINPENHNVQANKYRGDFPETRFITTNYDYVNPQNATDFHPVPWSVFVYGIAGVNSDVIRDAIVDYILSHSTHTRDEWEKIFPDLFTPTEFYIIPMWDKYSIPDETLQAGIYSPTVPLVNILPTGKKYAYGTAYTQAHLQANLTSAANIYKSLAFLAVGHPKNRHAPTRFDKAWPQYAVISSTVLDFDRIDPNTQAFMVRLLELIIAAEQATPFTIIPERMTRVVRNDHIYMTMMYGKVQYVCAAKQNFKSA